jgi:hypothetical protein
MTDTISWIATIATIIAASMTAANLGSRITGYGFCIFLIGSLAWLATGIMTGQPALTWTNVVLTILNIFGIWRWLGRQAKVEEGALAASEASEKTPGDDLFPISLLSRASMNGSGEVKLGQCIDAMTGCRSGRLAYVVVSQGGVAGIGETLRRVPWDIVSVEGETVVVPMDLSAFGRLEELPRDQWPAR